MEGWLDSDQPEPFVEAIDPDGEPLGWMSRRDANLLRYTPQIIETPQRYLDDLYVRYHAQLIGERHLYDGKDLNDVQLALLASNLKKRREHEANLREIGFEENLLVNNPEGYKAYMDKKKQINEAEGGGPEVEQRVPGSIEEFLATLAAFSEGDDADSGKEQEDRAEGWLSSILSSDDLDQMDD